MAFIGAIQKSFCLSSTQSHLISIFRGGEFSAKYVLKIFFLFSYAKLAKDERKGKGKRRGKPDVLNTRLSLANEINDDACLIK